jgi:hypothetical protein
LAQYNGLQDEALEGIRQKFSKIFDKSYSGQQLTEDVTKEIIRKISSHRSSRQMYILLLGGNNIRHPETTIEAEIKTLVKRVTLINEAVTKADDCRIILCSTVPDPQPKVDRNLMELDSALKRIQLGRGSQFLNLRTALTANHMLMTDCYKRGGKTSTSTRRATTLSATR